MRVFKHTHGSGYADCAAADDTFKKGHRFAAAVQKKVPAGSSWGCLAAIKSLRDVAIVMNQE